MDDGLFVFHGARPSAAGARWRALSRRVVCLPVGSARGRRVGMRVGMRVLWRAMSDRQVRAANRVLLLAIACDLVRGSPETDRWRQLCERLLRRAVELRQRSLIETPAVVGHGREGIPVHYLRNLVWFLDKTSVCACCKKSDYMVRFMNGATDKARARYFWQCDGCRVVRYCSRECQKRDWPAHKAHCAMPTAQLRRHTLLRKYLWWFTRHSYDGHWMTTTPVDGRRVRARAERCDGDCWVPHFGLWRDMKRTLSQDGLCSAVVVLSGGGDGHGDGCEGAWFCWEYMPVAAARRVLPGAPRAVWELVVRESARYTMFVWCDAAAQWHYELLLLEHGEGDSD